MPVIRLRLAVAAVAAVLPAANAILVAPGSPCSTNCGNVLDSTSSDDIGCTDSSFGSGQGQIFQGCVKCEMSSNYSADGLTDVQASLYNLRYTLSSCLFGVPNDDNVLGSNPCITSKACESFQEAIDYKNLTTKGDDYGYCDTWPIDDAPDFKGCVDCLQAFDKKYLSNFFVMLQAGCEQKPVPGITVAVEGDLFSTDHVNVTAPTLMATIDPAWFDHGPLNLSVKVGIAVGGFVLLLILTGVFIVWNGKRRRRAYLRKLDTKFTNRGWPSSQGHSDMFEAPVSQHALRGWDDSPMTPSSDRPFPRYVSPYTSQCNSPTSAQDMTSMPWPSAALARDHNIGVAHGGDSSSSISRTWENQSEERGKDTLAESYELHDVESSESGHSQFHHPLRMHGDIFNERPYIETPPHGYGLNEADYQKGSAI